MKHNPSWLAAGLVLFVVLACNLGKKSTNVNNSNSNREAAPVAEAITGPGEYIAEIHMAKDDASGNPGDKTKSFSASDRKIHCVVELKEPKAGTQMKFSWWIVDADGRKNQSIKDIDYATKPREKQIHGHLSVPEDWPTGKYKVQVFVNGDLDKTVHYNID